MAIDDTDEPSDVTTGATLIGAHTEDTNMAFGRNRFTRSSARRNITKATGLDRTVTNGDTFKLVISSAGPTSSTTFYPPPPAYITL